MNLADSDIRIVEVRLPARQKRTGRKRGNEIGGWKWVWWVAALYGPRLAAAGDMYSRKV